MHRTRSRRRGSILPLVAICLVGLIGFVALAIDIGLIVAARNQAQNAADLAAMAGARALDGSPGSNVTGATATAIDAAKQNKILGKAVEESEVQITHGYYYYDPGTETFSPRFGTPPPPDRYNLTQAVVTRTDASFFARVFNITSFTVSAEAIAAHRPRDVAIVLDFSGSMNNESDLWNNEGYLGSVNNSPNNTDAVFPTFGPYSSGSAAMQCVSSDPRVGKCNITMGLLGFPSLVEDFFQNSRGSAASGAFLAAPSSYATTPGGDVFLKTAKNTGGSWAQKVTDVVGTTSRADQAEFELDGYSAYLAFGGALTDKIDYAPPAGSAFPKINGFYGYTQGPKYYGKTFQVWPPDPRAGSVSATRVQQFLQEFGYTATEAVSGTSTNNLKVQGIHRVVAGISGSQNWASRTVDTAGINALKTYLTSVPRPAAHGAGNLSAAQAQQVYEKVLRLHNRPVSDWRARFFRKADGVTPVDDNTLLFDASGNWKPPVSGTTTNYIINYAAILAWIKEDPCPFPTQLRAGRILYYDAIPDDVPASAYNWLTDNNSISDANQRFWKEYIDYILGMWRDPFDSQRAPGSPACSYGPDFTWGTIAINTRPTAAPASPTGRVLPQYMNYADNPKRPRHRGWFGPMTMVQFISDTGLNPGTVHDVSMIAAKIGIQGALETIKNNHPNDLVSLIMFNRPRFNTDPPQVGAFSQAQIGLSRDYQGMIDALYYPPGSSLFDVRPWDSNGVQTPRSYGDFIGNTCTNYGLMVAYNQLSSSAALRSSLLGGTGRKGAQRLIVLETDGMANVAANASFSDNGPNNSYYNIGPSDNVTPGGSPRDAALAVAQRLCALESDSTNGPGFATARKPVILHCVAFGAVIEPTASGTEPDNVMALLQDISAIGGTGFPASRTDASDPNFYKLCTGTLAERQEKLRTAFRKIMDDGVAVTLIR
jgi:Flp pilus assembly protein TadG